MIGKLAEQIKISMLQKLDEIYNHRKEREGLASSHNVLCNDLRHKIHQWYEKTLREEKQLNERIAEWEKKQNV